MALKVEREQWSVDVEKSYEEALSPGHKEVERISLIWENVNLSMRVKDANKSTLVKRVYKTKRILRNIYGKAVSGELIAIMGPTGCGKTSLMNILAARVTSLDRATTKLTGTVLVNGNSRDDEAFRRISAYVLQDDRLFPHLTVMETLMLSAHFYQPDYVTLEQKQDIVNSIISELGLGKTVDTIVGNEKIRGISGGERKRACIAVQLITDPSVLFLDEPTSGLDSFQAFAVMEAMKNMALNGRLVISVLHQPRSRIFDMLDKLILLSEGSIIYHGDASKALNHFKTHGFEMNKFYNPADYFLDLLSPDSRTKELEEQSNSRIVDLSNTWKQEFSMEEFQSVKASLKHQITVETIPIRNPMTTQRYSRNVYMLFWRAFTELIRDKFTISVKLAFTVFFACLVGAMYSTQGDNQTAIRNTEGLLFIVVLNQAFNNVIGVLNTFPREKVVVNRERAAGAYDTFTYFVSKFLAELPINTLPALIYACIVYNIVGLKPSAFGFFILILMFLSATAIALGLAVSALAPNAEVANMIGIPCTIVALIFAGFYINIHSLPVVANWIPYISFMRWAFQALCINEFKGETFSCSGVAGSACYPTGEDVLKSLAFQNQTEAEACLGLGIMLIFFFVSALFILHMNRLHFISVGHVGRKMKHVQEDDDEIKIHENINHNIEAKASQEDEIAEDASNRI